MKKQIASIVVVLLTLGLRAAAESEWEKGDALYERRHYEEAAQIYEKAANAGDLRSLSRLAQFRMSAVGVPRDHARGKLEMRKAADGGIPEAMESVASDLWRTSKDNFEQSQKQRTDKQQQLDPKKSGDLEALQALEWERRAADAWLAEDKPYEAWRIASCLPSVLWRSAELIAATKETSDAIRREVETVPNDRRSTLNKLFSLPPYDKQVGELLIRILLPPNPPILDEYDIKRMRVAKTLEHPGRDCVALLKYAGQTGMCGTGRKWGGITPPDLSSGEEFDLALGFAPDGTLSFNYRVDREYMTLIDADGDNNATELIVCSCSFDYRQPPFLQIYDLRSPGVPLMLSLTFNADREPDRYPNVRSDEDDAAATIKVKPRVGSWKLVKREDGSNDIELSWESGTLRLPYNKEKRQWHVPSEKSDGFWSSP